MSRQSSIKFPWVACLAFLVSVSGVRAAQADPQKAQGTLASGAVWQARMPDHWNGTLLLFSHGYQPTLRSPEVAPSGMEDRLLDAGYALAASGYSAPGWAVAEAVPDQAATLDAFAEKFGKPKRTIAWGQSMGALVSVALAEQYPERIDGALPSCGSLAGSLGMMNEALDGAFAFKVLLAADTDVRVVDVDDDMANAGRVNRVLERALTTAQGRARLALASALAELPSWSGVKPMPPAPTDFEGQLDEAAGAFTRGVFLPRVDQEHRAGGVFSWNTGIDYKEQLRLSRRLAWVSAMYAKAGLDLDQDLNALNSAPRIAADAHAVAYMRAHYVPNGRLRIPVLSYHTTGDGMTSVEQQGAYRQRVREAGRGADLATAWVQRAGHCTFTPEEHWAALETLEARLTSKKWTVTAASLNARGTAAFVEYEPAPFLRPCGPTPGSCLGEPAVGEASRAGARAALIYSEVMKSSQYVAVEDGTRLAIDIYRPARGATAETAPLPVVLLHSLGPRSEPRTLSAYGVSDLVRHGYVFVWMQPRGVGASFGKTGGFLTAQNGRDARDVIAWAAKQSWSTGKVGMMGLSNLGFIQWLTAVQRPPGLVTIVPAVANPDFYYQLYPNGVSALVGAPGVTGRAAPPPPAAAPPEPVRQPVDEDAAPRFPLWESAQRSHSGGLTLPDAWRVNMMRDQMNPVLGYAPGLVDSPLPSYAAALRESGIRIYQFAGWADASPGGEIVAHRGYGTKLIIGAWPHMLMAEDQGGPLLRTEQLRWFNFTLKGIDDGIGKEPPIRYQTRNERDGDGWHTASQFPLPTQRVKSFHLGAGRSGSVASVNDGTLSEKPSASLEADDAYDVAFDVAAFGGAFSRLNRAWKGDMTADIDRRGLTYTSAVFTRDTELTGFPTAHIWLSANAPDADLIVYLEDVGPDGQSHFVTDGAARASHRRLDPRSPWFDIGVPFHRSFAADRQLLTDGQPVEVDFSLIPTSYLIRRGSRIRFTITGAEKNTYQPPSEIDLGRPLTLHIYRDRSHASGIDLPLVDRGRR